MFHKTTLLVCIIFMIFAFTKSEFVVNRKGNNVFKSTTGKLNCVEYNATEVSSDVLGRVCLCDNIYTTFVLATCKSYADIGCETNVFASFRDGELSSSSADHESTLKLKSRLTIGNRVGVGYGDGTGDCNILGDIFLYNTAGDGISGGRWDSIKSGKDKLWRYERGFLVEVMGKGMEGQLVKVVPAAGCANITCALVHFGGDVTYPVDIEKLQETPSPITSAPITSAPPVTTQSPETESASGQFDARYEYVWVLLVLVLTVIMHG